MALRQVRCLMDTCTSTPPHSAGRIACGACGRTHGHETWCPMHENNRLAGQVDPTVATCAHCPHESVVGKDGPHPLCWMCFTAFTVGVVRHVTTITPPEPVLASA